MFWDLIRARSDERFDKGEQQRAQALIDQILAPYQRLTRYLANYAPGTVEHDVSMLLLTKHPMDYQKPRHRWSVRLLSEVCRERLNTKSASRSQIGRFYKRLGWHKKITHKLVSPDPAYGDKMKTIGQILAQLTPDDVALWDSLNHLRLITAVETEFGVKFSMNDIQSIDSISKLDELIEAQT